MPQLRSRLGMNVKIPNLEPNIRTQVSKLNSIFLFFSLIIAPKSKLDDGLLWLLLVRRSALNRWKMVKLMWGFHNAAHVDFDFVEFLPVKSFKLEPLSQGSYLTVDGELIEHSNIRAEVVSKAIKILTKS